MSVRAEAESMASRPTRFRSKYGVASRPYKKRRKNIYNKTDLAGKKKKKKYWD